jgi:hypothetical protein
MPRSHSSTDGVCRVTSRSIFVYQIIIGKHLCRCGWCGTHDLDDLGRQSQNCRPRWWGPESVCYLPMFAKHLWVVQWYRLMIGRCFNPWASLGRQIPMSVDCRWIVGGLSVERQQCIGRQSPDCLICRCPPGIDRWENNIITDTKSTPIR